MSIINWYRGNIELLKLVYPDSDIDFDREDYSWVVLWDFVLPKNWRPRKSALLIQLPGIRGPINSPPKSFYLDKGLRSTSGRTPGHYFETRHGDPIIQKKGYAWYCLFIKSWIPTADIISGDNLATVVDIIYNAMK